MPSYLFIHPDTEEVREEIQKMNEPHVFIDENGIEWKRLYTVHNVSASTDANVDPFSERQFVERTRGKKLSVGDMWDMSAEMASKREAQTGGKDPVKEKYDKDSMKKRRGKNTPESNVRTPKKRK
jgi:hypothetical protein